MNHHPEQGASFPQEFFDQRKFRIRAHFSSTCRPLSLPFSKGISIHRQHHASGLDQRDSGGGFCSPVKQDFAGVCGGSSCTPRACLQQNLECGQAGDGCGGTLNCGTCPMGQVCGAGGPGRCGSGGCTPRTCADQGLSCGPAGDGCGNLIQCGNCTAPDTCGGGGTPGVCGRTSCQPRTCMQANAVCGVIADGCGGTVNCGTCAAPLTCGGGGIPHQCGGIM